MVASLWVIIGISNSDSDCDMSEHDDWREDGNSSQSNSEQELKENCDKLISLAISLWSVEVFGSEKDWQ